MDLFTAESHHWNLGHVHMGHYSSQFMASKLDIFNIPDDGKRWNSARSWCSFALGGGCGGGAWSVCKPNFWFTEQEGAVLAPWASFLPMLRASGMLGQRWHHIGLMLSTFRGILWFVLAFVGQELGPYWAYLGPFWAMLGHFGPCWHHIGLMLGHFGLFSDLCRPLFWTWAFQCC